LGAFRGPCSPHTRKPQRCPAGSLAGHLFSSARAGPQRSCGRVSSDKKIHYLHKKPRVTMTTATLPRHDDPDASVRLRLLCVPGRDGVLSDAVYQRSIITVIMLRIDCALSGEEAASSLVGVRTICRYRNLRRRGFAGGCRGRMGPAPATLTSPHTPGLSPKRPPCEMAERHARVRP
jgi:hypothetical protein